MGQRVLNFSVNTDYATPEKETAIELHMALTIPYSDLQKVQSWLHCEDWTSVKKYLTSKYPEHRQCLENWMTGSEARSRDNKNQKIALAA